MIAALAGLTAAVAWAISSLCSSRSSAEIGPWPVVGWVMVVGLLASSPLLILGGPPDTGDDHIAWFAVSGITNVLGLACLYAGMRTLEVSVAVAISAGGGALAALIGVITGSPATALMVVGILVVIGGILAAAPPPSKDGHRHITRGYAWACGSAAFFSLSIFAINKLSVVEPVGWSVVWPRIAGVLFVAVPLALRGRLPLTSTAAPLVIAAGLAELTGFIALAIGSRHSLVLSDVIASQYPLVTAIGAFLILGERLDGHHRVAVALVAFGVSLVAVGAR